LTDRPFGFDILFAEVKADRGDCDVVRYVSNLERLLDSGHIIEDAMGKAHAALRDGFLNTGWPRFAPNSRRCSISRDGA
jgi:hypothetical protein